MEGGSCPAAPESVLAVDFEQWAREHAPRLLRFATLLTGRRELAEDLTQDALLVAYQRWASIGAMEHPWAYVVRTLVNRHLATQRSAGRETRRLRLLAAPEAVAPGHGIEDRSELDAALAGLGDRQRAVVLLRHIDDLSDDQIAAALGCSVATVRSQSSRALAHLRAALSVGANASESRQS